MADAIGAVIIDIKSDISHLVKGMQKAEGVVDTSTTAMIRGAKLIATAWGVLSFKNLIDESAELADNVGKVAEKYAIGVEDLTKWHYTVSSAGVSNEQFNDSIKDMSKNITDFQRDGSGAEKAFKALGITQNSAKESMTDTSDSMTILLQKLGEMPPSMERTTVAMELFGEEGSSMVRVADMGTEAIKKYNDEAVRGNIAVSEAYYQKSAAYQDSQYRLEKLQGGFGDAVIEESKFLEMGTSMYEELGDVMLGWTEGVQNGTNVFVNGLGEIADGAFAVFPVVVEMIGRVVDVVGTMMGAVVDLVMIGVEPLLDALGLFQDEGDNSITVLGHFSGLAMGATMAIENFSTFVSISVNGLKMFATVIETTVLYQLDRMAYRSYQVGAALAETLNTVSFGELGQNYAELAAKAESYNVSSENQIKNGESEIAILAEKQKGLLSNIHTVNEMNLAMEATAIDVSKRQEEGLKFDVKKRDSYDKTNKIGTKALFNLENKHESLAKTHAKEQKALESNARAYEDIQKQLKSFENTYKKSTMSDFDYKLGLLEREKNEYEAIGAERLKVDEWYSKEFDKLLKSENDKLFGEWEKENNEYEKRLDDKYSAEKKYLEVTGKFKKLEAMELKEFIHELREDGLEESKLAEVYEIELRKMDKLNTQFVEDFKYGLSGMFSNIFSGGNIGDSLQGMLDGFSKNSMDDFAESLSDKISGGIADGLKSSDFKIFGEDGNLNDFGVQATVAGVNMLDGLLNSDKDLNGPEREGAIIGEAAGTAIGTYFGGPIGGSIGGAIGEFVGNKVGGALFGGDKSYYVDVDQSGEAYSMGHRSGGLLRSGKTWEITEESERLNRQLEDAFVQYGELLDFIAPSFEGILQLSEGKYDDAGVVFNEALPKEFFDAWINGAEIEIATSMAESIENSNLEGVFTTLTDSMDSIFGRVELTQNQQIVDALYEEWKDYAEGINQTVNEAIFEVLGNLKGKTISIDEYNLRNNNEELLNYRIDLLREQEQSLEQMLELGDVTLENYNDKMRELTENGASAEDLNNFIALGDTLMAVSDNSDALTQHLQGLSIAQVDASNALLEANNKLTESANANRTSFSDWHNTLEMSGGELYSYTLMRAREEQEKSAEALGVMNVTAVNYLDRFNSAIQNGMTEDVLNDWEKFGDNIKNVTNLQRVKMEEEQNFIDSMDFSNLDYRNITEKQELAQSNYFEDSSIENAKTYLETSKKTALNKYDYAFKYESVKSDFSEKIKSPSYASDGSMIISSPALEKRYDDLEKKLDELNDSTESTSKAEVAELRDMVSSLKELIKETRDGATNTANAIEQSAYQQSIGA